MYTIKVNTYVSHGSKKGIKDFIPGETYDVSDKDFQILQKAKVIQQSEKTGNGGGNNDDVNSTKDSPPRQTK